MTDIHYDPTVFQSQMFWSIIGNWFIQKTKLTALVPFFNERTYWLNKALGIAIAALTALGITYSYTYTANGVFTLVVNNLTLSGVWHGFQTFIVSYGMQQGAYHLTKPKEEK